MAKVPIKREKEFILCKGHNSPLLMCFGNKGSTEYYNSWSGFSDGKVPYCRICCDKMINHYLQETGSMQSALWYTLMKLDIPFIKEVYEKLNDRATTGDKNGKKIPISLGLYISELQKSTTKKDIFDDFSATNVDISDIDSRIQSRDVKQKEIDQWEIDWGKQKSIESYRFLINLFNEYSNGVEFVNPQQRDLYRDLCRDRLMLRELDDSRAEGKSIDEGIYDKVKKRISEGLNKLKIDDFESNKPKTKSEESFFAKIAQIEQIKPADLYKEPKKYKDFNQIRKYEEAFSLRPLLNTLAGHKDFNIDLDDVERYDLKYDR